LTGAKIAIFGLARSGLSVAKAAIALGATPTVVDEKAEESLKSRAILDGARQIGAEVRLGWDEEFGKEFDFVVTSPGVPANHPRLQGAVKNGIPVLSEVEFAYRISKAPIVAITGTNGKSTTTVMTYQCVLATGRQAILCGNIFGSGYKEVPLTDAALTASDGDVLVAEISSFQLEWVSTFRPIAAAITNITPDHFDRHATIEEYAEAKQRIFSAQESSDYAVIPASDPLIKPPTKPHVLTFGREGKDAQVTDNEILFGDKRMALEELPFIGEHNYLNASVAVLLASAVVARATGKPFAIDDNAIQGLKDFKGIAHRMEVVGEKKGIRVINNSMCTNPAAVISSSQAVKAPQHLLLGGSNKRLDFAPLQNYLEKSHNKAYLFGRDAEALNAQLGGGYPVFRTMAEAFQDAVRNANAGEVIMLAPGCASMDQFRDFEDRGNVFRTMAKEWLES